MENIYCLSGLGADEKIFSKLDFKNNHVTYIQWLKPEKSESICDYARRIANKITLPQPVLIGISFGGMMCIEIAKLITVKKVIIISSIKTRLELPFWLKAAGWLKLNKLFPMRSFKLIEPLEDYNLGIETTEEKTMVHEYRRTIDRSYAEWAINCVLNWQNKEIPVNVIHLHGDKDRIFKINNVNADHIIKTGGHFMVMNRAIEINKLLSDIISKA
ncbi:MAG: alpha/beta hydrolase [Ginsengibacter sp.]